MGWLVRSSIRIRKDAPRLILLLKEEELSLKAMKYPLRVKVMNPKLWKIVVSFVSVGRRKCEIQICGRVVKEDLKEK
jgi:hypothetical protein